MQFTRALLTTTPSAALATSRTCSALEIPNPPPRANQYMLEWIPLAQLNRPPSHRASGDPLL